MPRDRSEFFVKHYAKLIDNTVVSVAVDESGECYGLMFLDGTIAWIMRDPEGNGPGFLDIQPAEDRNKRN